ncbi:MAG: hypothetical protein GY867_00140 [bacterium]|nr:hypothetical protein [bacterium]
MIALVLTGIVCTAVMKLFTTQHQNYLVQDRVAGAQQNARAIIDALVRHVRMAGFDIPIGVDPLDVANADPDTIVVIYSPDDCEAYLASDMASAGSALECTADVSCFDDGQWVYIYDPVSTDGEWFQISTVQTGALSIMHTTALSRTYSQNAVITSLARAKFFVDGTSSSEPPTLMVEAADGTPLVYAEGIQDIQFRYRLANGTVVDEPILVHDVREVQISVTCAGKEPGDDEGENIGSPSRTFASSVCLRNFGL